MESDEQEAAQDHRITPMETPKNTDRSRESDNLALELSLRPPVNNRVVLQQQQPPVLLPMPPLLFRQTSNQMLVPHPSTSTGYLPAGSSHIERANSLTALRIRRSFGTYHSSSGGICNSRSSTGKPKTTPIRPPYPWSTELRAVVHTLNYLRSNQILTITGDVRCRRCHRQYQIEYDLVTKFDEIATFIEENKDSLHDRAPSSWMYPKFPTCKFCNLEDGAVPVIPEERRRINWLFLLLGQTLGILNLEHLKYFCTYTNNHRTGAKNRLLYLTYLTLCKQVDPNGPFDR